MRKGYSDRYTDRDDVADYNKELAEGQLYKYKGRIR